MRDWTGMLAVGVVCLVGLGCGEAEQDAEAAAASAQPELDQAEIARPVRDQPEIEQRVLAEFQAGDERHSFLQWGSGPEAVIAHRISGTAGGSRSMLPLASTQPQPTLLEIFLALAPEGLAPPAELLERHAPAARRLGRTEEVLPLTVEKQFTPPPGIDACEPSLFFDVVPGALTRGWGSQIIGDGVGVSYQCIGEAALRGGLPDASSCTFLSRLSMMAGICAKNDPVIFRLGFGTRDTWSLVNGTLLAPGQYTLFYLEDFTLLQRMAISGEGPIGYGMRGGVLNSFPVLF